jgi:hypothetical protein
LSALSCTAAVLNKHSQKTAIEVKAWMREKLLNASKKFNKQPKVEAKVAAAALPNFNLGP